ncbi:acyltransferase [Kushneria phosphatilytica]|uniref:Acyltransferase n=1 Tax=Kushneria phosphatilytica TaxID=657387 RepID=A0A1S1NYN6_9GAMM|nr:acyltransferase [Kushneria phosphatilytica]OHV11973.1 acyltransferase [Kushneria phosphatilytica]QEL11158.1 acyltransferase [Kushneria phosphatilytica]
MSLIKGAVSVLLLTLNTLLWCPPVIVLALFKLLPSVWLRRHLLDALEWLANGWIATNNLWIRYWLKPDIRFTLPNSLSPDQWWLVMANHRSWTDIFILQYALAGRLPTPRFFIKRELLWLPIMGLAWWALEFPFVRRYSREQLERDPGLAQRDQQATRRMCANARQRPMAIYNFLEGTRFTPEKHRRQQSPYQHLLRPRAGGCAQVVDLLGDRLAGIIDITLDYRAGQSGFGAFLCGRTGTISMNVRHLDIPSWMHEGNYSSDAIYRERFQAWVNTVWQEKDQQLSSQEF